MSRPGTVTGGLAALACAACCALPLFIAAGVLTGAAAALLERTLLAVAAGLAVAALAMGWGHSRRGKRCVAAGDPAGGCGATGCACVR
ncbi:hypothetical protein COUCH_27610 [Couchioplanes caeruleus]|uniref:hypothetical protein n=1 Tax=Couchioplanes caeruleus TaxID=56438 RepID=UPI0020C07940|nr:hypothetical protein [Couchioplanes caeruleus]UQU62784.1 hypothetical protein COUCH_27610 [Couchioplanes caeruleus]